MRLLRKLLGTAHRDDALRAVHAPLANRAADDPEGFARLVLDLDPRTALDPARAKLLIDEIADALIAHERDMALARRQAAEQLVARLEHAVTGLELEESIGFTLESAPEPIIDEDQAAAAVARVTAALSL
jgi:ABC-type Zn uptake system ZnuABC Zn-binding protein ZnuA